LRSPKTKINYTKELAHTDFADIRGQEGAKRGPRDRGRLVDTNIAMYWSARHRQDYARASVFQLLPDLNLDEVLENYWDTFGGGKHAGRADLLSTISSPHHTASYVSIIGGGTYPKPGEVTLAHKGVLFLDEFPEFEKRVIESLRQPLEDNIVSILPSPGYSSIPLEFLF